MSVEGETRSFLGYEGCRQTTNFPKEDLVEKFLARYSSRVTSVVSGFDRVVFRGALPRLRDRGMHVFLGHCGKQIIDFAKFAQETTARVEEAALVDAVEGERPIRYLDRTSTSKEELARNLLVEHPIDEGLICVLKAVEPCMSFEYKRSPNPTERGLRLVPRKCLHLYKYFVHPVFGFMNARIQTWFPFNVQICLNGREWLARQLQRRHSKFIKVDNCLPQLGNPELAQRLMDEQLRTDWPSALGSIARELNPLHDEIFRPWPMDYYWIAYQTEWATDVSFKDAASLATIYPAFVRHAMHHFKSEDVMRFLGRKAHARFLGELTSRFKHRPEGMRVKHWIDGNSIKMYDKADRVLRVEATIGEPRPFRVFRPAEDAPGGKAKWMEMRKGVADLHRRAQVSQRANESYLDALSVVDDTTPCGQLFDAVARPVADGGRRYRGLRIGDPREVELLSAIARGEFKTAGFRNRDIRRLLHPQSATMAPHEQRRCAARIGRRLRLLRAHGLIRKVQRSHRYELTARGRLLTAALFALRDATLGSLLGEAA